MPPATLHGVGVISELYISQFLRINDLESLAQRSFKVIHFGGNRKPVYDFIQAVNSNFRYSTVSEILPVYTPRANCVSARAHE